MCDRRVEETSFQSPNRYSEYEKENHPDCKFNLKHCIVLLYVRQSKEHSRLFSIYWFFFSSPHLSAFFDSSKMFKAQ